MKQCKICYTQINPSDYVEWIKTEENYKYILGKYKWVQCDYCFDCITVSKTLLWHLYLNTLLNTNCQNTINKLLTQPLPVYITDNLGLIGKPIKALYYHNQMYSAKLNTGLTDYQFFNLNKIIEKYKNSKINKINEIQYLLGNMNMNMNITAS